jgi:hypothetical protein
MEVDGRALPILSLVAFFIGLILALNKPGCREVVRAESANRVRLVRYFLETTSKHGIEDAGWTVASQVEWAYTHT